MLIHPRKCSIGLYVLEINVKKVICDAKLIIKMTVPRQYYAQIATKAKEVKWPLVTFTLSLSWKFMNFPLHNNNMENFIIFYAPWISEANYLSNTRFDLDRPISIVESNPQGPRSNDRPLYLNSNLHKIVAPPFPPPAISIHTPTFFIRVLMIGFMFFYDAEMIFFLWKIPLHF